MPPPFWPATLLLTVVLSTVSVPALAMPPPSPVGPVTVLAVIVLPVTVAVPLANRCRRRVRWRCCR